MSKNNQRRNTPDGVSEPELHRTLDSIQEGIQIIGFDWRYLYLNKAAVKHARKSKKDLLAGR